MQESTAGEGRKGSPVSTGKCPRAAAEDLCQSERIDVFKEGLTGRKQGLGGEFSLRVGEQTAADQK